MGKYELYTYKKGKPVKLGEVESDFLPEGGNFTFKGKSYHAFKPEYSVALRKGKLEGKFKVRISKD